MSASDPFVVDSIVIDKENAFLLYAAFTGDVERTAHALNVRAVDVLSMAEACGWNEKLRGILELKRSGKPGDVERAVNRALNFVQAHRFRMFLERIMARITGMTHDEIDEYLFTGKVTQKGDIEKKMSTRALADLASALEKCHAMSYLALSDTAQDRAKRNEAASAEGGSASEMHVRIAEAMQKLGANVDPKMQLIDAQLLMGAQTARDAKTPLPPRPAKHLTPIGVKNPTNPTE